MKQTQTVVSVCSITEVIFGPKLCARWYDFHNERQCFPNTIQVVTSNWKICPFCKVGTIFLYDV
jgi:hypothetical protein